MAGVVKTQSGLDDISIYVPGRPVEEVQREFGITDVIKLASNENPEAPAPKAVAAMDAALTQVNFYPDGDCFGLRQALATHLGVRPEQVAVGNGADGLIMQTCMAYLDDGDEVIVSRSSFPVYDVFARAMRARLIKTPLKDHRLDLEAMRLAVTTKTKLLFVCNPNNPTGTVVTAVEAEALVQAVPESVLIVFDEAYHDFVDSPDYPKTVPYVQAGRRNVMVLRSYSKVYGLAGVRLGYAIADADVLAPLNKIKEPFCVNSLAQAAGVAALQDQDYLRHSIAQNAAGREYLYRRFDAMGLSYVRSHTNFILVRIGPQAQQVVQALLAKGVIVRPCGGYDLPESLRITVGDPAQNVRLIEALGSVLRAAP